MKILKLCKTNRYKATYIVKMTDDGGYFKFLGTEYGESGTWMPFHHFKYNEEAEFPEIEYARIFLKDLSLEELDGLTNLEYLELVDMENDKTI